MMRLINSINKLAITSLLFSILIVRCARLSPRFNTDQTEEYLITSEPIPTHIEPSKTPSTEVERFPTKTFVRTPTLSKTRTLKSTPNSYTAIQRLPQNEALERLLNIYSNNGGCKLPCWWGIIPGVTTGADALSILAPLGQVRVTEWEDGLIGYGVSANFSDAIDPFKNFMASLFVLNNVVVTINTSTVQIEPDFEHTLAGILNRLGQPDQVWFYIDTDTMDGRPRIKFELFFPTKGINIGITEYEAVYEVDLVKVCPQNIFNRSKLPPGILLWSPVEELQFDDLPIYVPNLDTEKFRLLEDLTDEIDTQSFYETYRDPKTTHCFHVPLDKIPGYATPIPYP